MKTRMTETFGIQYPIMLAGMNWLTTPKLVAAVSNAGGLGVLAGQQYTADKLREAIKAIREQTDKPFGINLTLGAGARERIPIVIEEKVPVAIVSVGRPDAYTRTLKDAGMKVLHAISTARHAKTAQRAGVDGVICEGFEAGGHKGFTELTTLVLTPMVVEAVEIPVVAGGGICDAGSVIAALALGADGVYMGTRFMATTESDSHPRVKENIVKGEDVCTVSVPKDKMLARDLGNAFTGKYIEMKQSGADSDELNNYLNDHSQFHAQHLGMAEDAEICCGQIAGLIPGIQGAGEVVEEISGQIQARFETLRERLGVFLQ